MSIQDSSTPAAGRGRRSGGRSARVAMRAAPLADDIKPVRGGMEGGRYSPLTDGDIAAIHETALRLLEEVGMADAPDTGIAHMTAVGATLADDGRLRFPRALVMEMVAKAARDFPLCGRDPAHDIWPQGARVHYGTAGAAVHAVDPIEREYRESTLLDLYQAARLVDQLENIHYFQRTVVARDMEDATELDLNSLYACLAGTSKHIGVSFTSPQRARMGTEMCHLLAGGEEAWRARPFVSNSNTFVVPPMKFGTESCEVMEVLIEGGMPILLLSAGQAGATAPAALPGAVAQAVAECLAGVVYVNAMKPGHPAIFGTWPFVSDLRSGAMSGGSGEQALLTAACAQMGRHYNLPIGSAAGMTDAKLPDMQAGFERGITDVMAGLAGLNLVYESVGMHASLLGYCPESLIIDNDLIGQCLRCVRGISVTEDSLSFDVIRNVCLEGPGHYLGNAQTLSLMQRDYLYPKIADRTSPKEWLEIDRPDIVVEARKRKETLLAAPLPRHIPEVIDAEIRAKYPIRLAVENMGLDGMAG
ncbi:MAG: trimethylamine methyltransferase family protein [Pseudomonadota bacterium]